MNFLFIYLFFCTVLLPDCLSPKFVRGLFVYILRLNFLLQESGAEKGKFEALLTEYSSLDYPQVLNTINIKFHHKSNMI